jgi:hypothetical protein
VFLSLGLPFVSTGIAPSSPSKDEGKGFSARLNVLKGCGKEEIDDNHHLPPARAVP